MRASATTSALSRKSNPKRPPKKSKASTRKSALSLRIDFQNNFKNDAARMNSGPRLVVRNVGSVFGTGGQATRGTQCERLIPEVEDERVRHVLLQQFNEGLVLGA